MKAILASVGIVHLFDKATNALISTSKTLTDSAINMSVSAEEARGGQGNVLLGKYYHDSTFGLTLTDQLFDLNYLSLNCGGSIVAGADVLKNEQVTVTEAGKIKVTDTPVAFPTTNEICGWYKLASASDDAWSKITFEDNVANASVKAGDTVCVKYFYNSASARRFTVSASYIPSVVHAVLTVPMFKAGTEESSYTSSSQIGELIIDIPNFQLNGAQDLSLTSGGIATSSLTGDALATFTGAKGCSDKGYYAEISENIFNKDQFENVTNIVVDDSDIDLKAGETQKISVYAMYSDGTNPTLIDPSLLTYAVRDGESIARVANGVVTAVAEGTAVIDISVTTKDSLSATAVATVTA